MEDMLVKFMMILLAVIMTMLLITFSLRLLNFDTPDSSLTKFKGSEIEVSQKISSLCSKCQKPNSDCYIIDIEMTDGSITSIPGIQLADILSGTYTIKIFNNDSRCSIKKLD
jgi:hypothetical protein